MNGEKAKASVQYDDMKGTVAADWIDSKSLDDFVQSQAIDIQNYIPIGISVYLGEPRGPELDFAYVSIFAVDPIRIGGDADSIRSYVESHQNILPCKKFKLEMPLTELLKFFKRFNIILNNRHVGNIIEFQLE